MSGSGDEPREAGSAPPVPEGRREAVFDPFAGLSGDMVLGCWSDLGLDPAWLHEVADALRIRVREARVERVVRCGIAAGRVVFDLGDPGGDPEGRTAGEIREIVESSPLAEETKRLALGAFARLARAEGRVHGVAPEEVHFHELGARDALLDICGAADGYRRLGVAAASTHPVAVGTGSVEIRHGRYPVPAPATAYLLEGTATRHTGYDGETTTPTGAALLREFTGGRPAAGDMVVERVGYGAGTRDPEDRPNCLRVWIGRRSAKGAESLLVLQADLDDLTPEYLPELVDACLEAGARDAVVRSVHMKKGRRGWRVEAVVPPWRREAVEEALFRHSTTLGIRGWPVTRRVLPRWSEERTWRGHPIRLKFTELPTGDGALRRAKPEHDDVASAAAGEGMSTTEVLRALRDEWPDLR